MSQREESFTQAQFRNAFARKWQLYRGKMVGEITILGQDSSGIHFFWEDEVGDRHFGVISDLSTGLRHRHIPQAVSDSGNQAFTSDAVAGYETAVSVTFTPEQAPYMLFAIGRVRVGTPGTAGGSARIRLSVLTVDENVGMLAEESVTLVSVRRETVTTARTYQLQVDSDDLVAGWNAHLILFAVYERGIIA